MARLAIGGRGSQELVAHANSGFVTYEDALDYKMIWTKELYLASYATQNIKVVQVQIDLTADMVFVAINNPSMLLKISGATGAILKQKVLFYSGTYSSAGLYLHSIAYLPQIDYLALYFSTSNQVDFINSVSASDLFSDQGSAAELLGLQNFQARKYMKVIYDPSTTRNWLEYYALANYGGVLRSILVAMMFGVGGVITPYAYYTDAHQYAVATNHLYWENNSNYVRFGCLMTNNGLANGGGSFVGFFIQTNYFGAFIKFYTLFSGVAAPSYVYCREVFVTSTIRPFLLIQHFDSTLPAGQQQFLNLVELSSIASNGVIGVVTQTKLQYFQSSFSGSTFSNYFPDNGNHMFMYAANAFGFQGRTSRTKHTGFLS